MTPTIRAESADDAPQSPLRVISKKSHSFDKNGYRFSFHSSETLNHFELSPTARKSGIARIALP
jgi:hypothetical protein